MITNNDIIDAIAELVQAAFPGEALYRNYKPTDYKRPSNLVVLSGGKVYPNFGCGTVELCPQVTLSTFPPSDAYQQCDTAELVRRQMTLLGLFLPGYIRVKDRAPHVLDEGEMENGLDFAAVTVTLSYTLDRSEFMEAQQLPDMGTLRIRQEVTTHG